MSALRCLLLSGLMLLMACEQQPSFQVHHHTVYALGTRIDIQFSEPKHTSAENIKQELERRLHQFHQDYHAWQPSLLSDIENLCHDATSHSLNVNPTTARIIRLGQAYERLTQGYFNPAAGLLIETWGFLSHDMLDSRPVPSDARITQALSNLASTHDLKLQKNHDSGYTLSCSQENMRLDIGGYGKGYIVDDLINELKKQGVTNALINAGGDIMAYRESDGPPWQIALSHPAFENDTVMAYLPVEGTVAVASSGLSERYFKWQGEKYAHIINPKTGHPVLHHHYSVVVADNLSDADALATALMIAGPDSISDFVPRFDNVSDVLWIDEHGTVWLNESLYSKVQWNRPNSLTIEFLKPH